VIPDARSAGPGRSAGVTGVVFTADGKAVVTTGIIPYVAVKSDGVDVPSHSTDPVRVWSVPDGRLVRQAGEHGSSLAAAPGGLLIVGGVDPVGVAINSNEEGWFAVVAPRVALLDPRSGRVVRQADASAACAAAPDGRLLALAPGSPAHVRGLTRPARATPPAASRLRLVEAESGGEVLSFPGVAPAVVAFSPDGRRVLYGTAAGEVGLADVVPAGVRPPADRTALGAAWEALRGEDPAAAYRAVCALAAAPEAAPRFLRERLLPAAADDPGLARLIADLDAPRYAVRRAALLELERRGADAVPALRAALAGPLPAEARRRVEEVLAGPAATQPPDAPGRARALRVLRRIGTPEAKAAADALAGSGR